MGLANVIKRLNPNTPPPPRAVVPPAPTTRKTLLRFCRCSDCEAVTKCPLEHEGWLYCADYRGPTVDPDYLVVPGPGAVGPPLPK